MKNKDQLNGKCFGKLTVISESEPDKTGKRKWLCKCECGNEKVVLEQSLCRGATKSCGCLLKKSTSKRMSKGWSDIITKAYLTKHHVEDKTSLRQIARNLGCTLGCIKRYMTKFEIKANAGTYDIIGKKFNKLTVVSMSHVSANGSYWNVKCDCGNEKVVQGHSLTRHAIVSCGCWNKEKCWKGCGDLSMTYWSKLKANAKKRGLEFAVTIEQAWDLFLKQEQKCALSGVLLVIDREHGQNCRMKNTVVQTASFDRIDSSVGYVEGNVQWVHVRLNVMKMNLDQNEFINWCKTVSFYQKNATP